MYDEWKAKVMERTCEKVLKTIDHTLDHAESHLDMVELDTLKDCYKVLHYVHSMKESDPMAMSAVRKIA